MRPGEGDTATSPSLTPGPGSGGTKDFFQVTRSAGRGEVRAERGSRLNLKETGSFLSGEHGTESPLSRLTAPHSPCLRSQRNSIRT
ncbi:hypothetical protein F2P79_010693 [Pimephales promelas]|nr:hypothetical protein F2P79_010693 [Pimephales promelas]